MPDPSTPRPAGLDALLGHVAANLPDDDNPQIARQLRREPLLHLLSRMQRGVLLAAERPLLRAAVEAELADGDQAHRRLVAAQAENDGLAETMRNTDRLTSQEIAEERAAHEGHRQQLAVALGNRTELGKQWDMLIKHAAEAHRWATDAAVGRNPAAVRAKERAEAAEAALTRIRELHRKASDGDTCVYCAAMQRLGYDATWPCDTIRALDGGSELTAAEAPCFHPVVQVDNGRRQCTGCGEWLDPGTQETAVPLYGPIEAAAELLITAARALRDAITPPDRP